MADLRRIVLMSLLLACLVGGQALFARGTKEAPVREEVLIAGVPTYLDRFDSFLLYSRGMEAKLERLGVPYRYVLRAPPGGFADHTGQRTIYEDMLALGADIIMTLPTSIELQHASFEMIVDEYQTPLVITDYLNYVSGASPPKNDRLVFFASYSHADMGKAVADYVARTYPRGNRMAMIKGLPGVISEERASDHLHLENGMNIIYEHYADFNREKAYTAAQDLLSARPDVRLILGMNSTMAMGIVMAVDAAGMLGQVDVIGFGGIVEELEAVARGRMKATAGRNHFDVGEHMAEIVIAFKEGNLQRIPKSYATPIRVYDSAESIAQNVDRRYFEMFSKDLLELLGVTK